MVQVKRSVFISLNLKHSFKISVATGTASGVNTKKRIWVFMGWFRCRVGWLNLLRCLSLLDNSSTPAQAPVVIQKKSGPPFLQKK